MMNPDRPRRPELLLPAGERAILQTAVDNGADAVYLGASAFSARGHAPNFDDAALSEAVAYAHARSTRVYLAINTLIADEELADALGVAVRAAAIGVDAMILQDLGLARLIGEALPGLPLHASTQMTIYDDAALPALKAASFHRIILPRELSLPEVAAFTRAAHAIGLETEIFVHGALCVSFSGQCLFSSLTSGRSGNRGVCAQPCRLAYRLREDGRLLPAEACLSPRDQAAFAHLKAVAATGVDSLKIEGRMRSAAYVAQAAATYRTLLDEALAAEPTEPAASTATIPTPTLSLRDAEERLLLAFNRGGRFTDRAFSGRKDRTWRSGSHVGSHGIHVGTVVEARIRGGVLVIDRMPGAAMPSPEAALPERGDVLSVRRPERKDEMDPADRTVEVASAPIGTVEALAGRLLVQGFHPDALARLRPGDQVYRMNSARREQALLANRSRRTPIAIDLSTVLNGPNADAAEIRLQATVSAGPFAGVSAVAAAPADPAVTRPLLLERAREQLAKTGGTPFQVEALTVAEPIALSIGGLNQLRRDLLAQLGDRLAAISRREPDPETLARMQAGLAHMLAETAEPIAVEPIARTRQPQAEAAQSPHIAAMQARPPQTAAYFYRWPDPDDALACGADTYLLPTAGLESPVSLEQLERLRADEPNALCVLVLPPAAAGLQAEQLRQWRADGTLRRFDRLSGGHPGLAGLAREAGIGFEADVTANIYNHRAMEAAASAGAQAICPSPELTSEQQLRLAAWGGRFDGVCLEWPVYGRQRLMYTAYCPIGSNVEGCRRCQGHRYLLQDRKDRQMPLLLHPPYCTATILHADMVAAPTALPQLARLAPARLRLMFLDEQAAERRRLIDQARRAVDMKA